MEHLRPQADAEHNEDSAEGQGNFFNGDVFAANRGKLIGRLQRLYGNHDLAEEAVDEAACRVLEKGAIVNPEATVNYWSRAAQRVALDALRGRYAREAPLDEDALNAIDVPEQRTSEPEANVVGTLFTADILQRLVNHLSPTEMATMRLWAESGDSFEEMATKLACTPNVARSAFYRAKTRLRRLIEEGELTV